MLLIKKENITYDEFLAINENHDHVYDENTNRRNEQKS